MQEPLAQSSFAPLAELLASELGAARLPIEAPVPASPGDFTLWYLQAVQLLEAHVAGEDAHAPMTRGEVELMCRCALSGLTLRECIELTRRYCDSLYPRAGQIELQEVGGLARVRQHSLRGEITTASSLVDITGLFAFSQLFQWLVGQQLPLQRVCIGPIEREDVLPFLKLFRAPVLAGGESYALEFDPAALDWPNVRSAGDFPAFFELFPCAVFDTRASELRQQVAALLVAAARSGQGVPTQQSLAASLGIPLSTFRRRLAEEGSSFKQLRTECLRDVAEELLQRGELRMAEIAQRLGYSDPGSLRRAMRAWEIPPAV